MSPYSCAQITPEGVWNGEYGLKPPLIHMNNLMVRGITRTMARLLSENPAGFEHPFCFNRCAPCLFRWDRIAPTAGIVSILAGSTPLTLCALLSGLSAEDDNKASDAMEARLARDARPQAAWGLSQIMINRPLVITVAIDPQERQPGGDDLLTHAFADVYFLSTGALKAERSPVPPHAMEMWH